MWRLCYSLRTFAGGLCFIFLAPSSFGSDHLTQEEMQEKIRTSTNVLQTAVPFSPESTLPHDVRIYILSFLTDQNDLLRAGAASKSWRKATATIWDKRALNLSNKSLTKADYTALAQGIFPRLTLNKVGLNEEGMNILATGSHLQALELRDNNLHATESLIKLLSLSHLSHIGLSKNTIGAEGAKAVAGALSQNMTLATVDLYDNSIGEEGAKAIAGALSQNRTLTTVNLRYNKIGDEGAKAIAGVLSQNTTLTRVNLYNNSIGDEGAKAIAELLSQNTTLTTIDLGGNKIGAEGAKAIAEAISQNRTLTTVNLWGNWFGDEGAKAIAGALSKNMTLTTVNLWSNSIGDEEAKAVAESLSQNKTLTTVMLGNNRIGDVGKKPLEDLKRSRPSLKLGYFDEL